MGIEKLFKNVVLSGRKTVSYILTDPFGESCLVAGGYMINRNAPTEITYPLILAGLYHTTRLIINRIKLNNLIKRYGWNKKIIEKFSEISWCSNMMLRAYLWGSKKYYEVGSSTKRYNISYFTKKGLRNFEIFNLFCKFH